jgi:hypothetical protein
VVGWLLFTGQQPLEEERTVKTLSFAVAAVLMASLGSVRSAQFGRQHRARLFQALGFARAAVQAAADSTTIA